MKLPNARTQPSVSDVAFEFHRHGIRSLLPVRLGEKSPDPNLLPSWKPFQVEPPTNEQLIGWFDNGVKRNIFIVCGEVNRLVVVDCDNDAAVEFWERRVGRDLLWRTTRIRTSKGRHFYFRLRRSSPRVQSWRRHEGGLNFEVQSDGAGVVGPGSIHESGAVYRFEVGLDQLQDAPRGLAEDPQDPNRESAATVTAGRSRLVDLLHSPPDEGGRNDWLTRVAGHYARSFKHRDAYEHHVRQANAALRSPLPASEVAKTATSIWTAEHNREAIVRPFEVVNLAGLAERGVEPPVLLCGDLLYRGAVHWLAGPPDSGKSMIMYAWTLALLDAGEPVLLFDQESGREQVVEKLLTLGAQPAALGGLHYVEFPARSWDAADLAALRTLLEDLRPALVGFDSSAAFLAMAGLDEDRAPDVTRFCSDVLLPIAKEHQAAVMVLDHVVKSGEGGRYARGSGAKLAATDVSMVIEIVSPFSRGRSGILKLQVTKDTRGWLHRGWEIAAKADTEGGLHFEFRKVDPAAEFRPTVLMERISREIERDPGLAIRQIRDRVRGKAVAADLALSLLVAEGFVRVERSGNRHSHFSIKPFRKDDEEGASETLF